MRLEIVAQVTKQKKNKLKNIVDQTKVKKSQLVTEMSAKYLLTQISKCTKFFFFFFL